MRVCVVGLGKMGLPLAAIYASRVLDANSEIDYGDLDGAVEAVGRGLRPETLVLIETTVPVGDTRNRFGRLLERTSGYRIGEDFYLAFSPERVQSNRVLRDLR